MSRNECIPEPPLPVAVALRGHGRAMVRNFDTERPFYCSICQEIRLDYRRGWSGKGPIRINCPACEMTLLAHTVTAGSPEGRRLAGHQGMTPADIAAQLGDFLRRSILAPVRPSARFAGLEAAELCGRQLTPGAWDYGATRLGVARFGVLPAVHLRFPLYTCRVAIHGRGLRAHCLRTAQLRPTDYRNRPIWGGTLANILRLATTFHQFRLGDFPGRSPGKGLGVAAWTDSGGVACGGGRILALDAVALELCREALRNPERRGRLLGVLADWTTDQIHLGAGIPITAPLKTESAGAKS